MIAQRKDDHVRLAVEQQRGHSGHNQFDEVSFVHHALAGIDRPQVSLATGFAGVSWTAPLYINAMTGGSVNTGLINRDLATAARETGVPIASGSMSAYFKDPSCAETFSVLRTHNPGGFVMANINATASVDNARRAVDLLQADALQIHLNTVQETVMPEGDRSFGSWPGQIEKIAAAVDVPVIVKEVGNGLSRQSVLLLGELGVAAADLGGRGGTDFARIENGRRALGDYAYLHDWGQSTAACLLDAQDAGLPVLASGGVRHPLDVARALALGASAVGASGGFLRTLLDGGVEALVGQLKTWLDQLAALQTMLGAPTPAALTGCDVLIEGSLRAFCADRGIDTARLARRTTTTAAAAGAAGTTMNPAAHTATTAGAGAETGAGAAETTGSTR
ncbi:type 2 isopentenyl-diphosphate Delta-isomerase [Streptomyces sp. NPDC006610]|uniref:type 2 isopentenyl-diphosphate Delta-isomerase n=1 Tax=Streptomyces sp. NPDC006610 TaxID=3154584 RepID=UPI0033BBF58A